MFIAVVTVLFAAVVTAEPLIMKAKVSHRAYDQNDYSYVFALSKVSGLGALYYIVLRTIMFRRLYSNLNFLRYPFPFRS